MIGIKRHYTSANQMVADQARSNYLFRESDYLRARETGTDTDYLLAMANTKDNLDASFDVNVYDRLSDDDRFNYFLHKNYGEKGTENYDKTEEYFNNQIEQIKRQEIYNSLSGFEKAVNSIGGFVGNAVLQLGGIVEGVVDAGTLLVGAAASIFDKEAGQDIKEFISKDATGYGAAQQAMNDYINTYTFIDKNGVTKVINDVTTGIVRMTPMIVGNLLTPVTGGVSSVIGNTIYYASMAGNTAEETIRANPDINYLSLIGYTGASVGLEALTEWASGKIFGDDIVSAMLKGEKYAPTGSIFKNIVKNFTTEGLEEATTELFGSILYNTIVDPKADIASFGDIMYAALIGGLTGAIMSGGQVITTSKMSVIDGKLVDTASLTKEQRKAANNLSKAQSYGLKSLINQAQQATQQTDEVTKLMSKYGLSLQDIQTEHAQEYQKALEKDTETKTQQAKGILELANLMNTIGVEQFQRSSKLLNEHIEEARTMVNNYLNHSAEYNKAASEAYSAAFDGQSMTPTVQLTNSEQTLVKTLREVYPNLKVAFGTFGSKEGLSVRSIAGTKGWLFIESGLVDKMGYQALLEHAIKNEMTNSMITELEKLPAELSNSLVRIVTEDKTSFKDLSDEQKQTIAQIVCFDPVNNRRIFRSNNKAHSEIFKYITDQANFIKNYARKNDANTLRYRELLKIRNTFLNSIAQTINNAEDVEFVTNEYKLAQDEVKTKIIDKTNPSILNINRKLTSVNLAKDAILREEAISELLDARNKLDKTTEFDYSRLYDESYYTDKDWVNSIKTQQQTNDFEKALKQHLVALYKTSFDDRTNIVTILKNNLKEQDVRKAAKELLTKEFNTNVTDYNVLQNEVVNTLYDMLTTEIDDNTDYIVVEDNTIKGAGKLKIIKSEVADGKRILSEEQRREDGESSGEQTKRLAPNTAKYENKLLETAALRVQTEDSLDEHQQKLKSDYKQKYNLDLKFFKGNISYRGQILDNANGLVSGNTVYLKYDGTLTDVEIDYVLEHEATHKLFAADEKAFEEIKSVIEDYVDRQEYNEAFRYYASDEMYGKIYDHDIDAIKEELINDIIVGEVTLSYSDANEVNKKIEQFKERATSKLSGKIDAGVKFSIDTQTKPVKKQPNITEKDISKLSSTEYRSGKKEKSTAKGYEGREYEVASVLEYEEHNGDTLDKIKTLDDLKVVLKAIEDGKIASPESGFVMDLLQSVVIPFNFKADRYAKAKALFDETQSVKLTQTAQEMASRSELFAETNPMKALSDELSEKFGTEIKPSDKMMIKWVPMYADRTNWLNRLKAEYDQIVDKRKHTKDPYQRQQYTLQLQDLRSMIQAVADNDTATILDLTMKQLQDTDENRAKNSEKVQELVKDFVQDLISHTDTTSKTPKYDPTKKYILKPEHAEKIADFWDKINAFRYLAMLSSPVTGVRNATTNTLVYVNAIVEDAIGGKIEKSKFLRNDSQANFTGDYDDAFSKFVEDRYKSRIAMDTKGDKYHTSEIDMVRQEWAAENDPLKKSKLLYTIKQLEQKMLNDQPWTTRRVMRNLKNTLAGSINMISKNAYAEVKALYKGSTPQEILTNMREKNSPLADLFEQVYVKNNGNDMVGVMDLASKLTHTSTILDQIYNNALYRGNKLLFKTDNILSKKINQLRKKHPMTAAFVSAFIPFAKTSYNTTAYIVNHSPIGLVKGIVQALQTRNMYVGDMQQAIKEYHKTEYIKQHKEANEDFTYKEAEFTAWANSHLSTDVVSALNGNYDSIKQIFNQYVELGRVNQNIIGSSDIFARATTIESITQGLTGTAWMTLGLILGALCKGFKIDDDDYLGPVLTIDNIRIKLDDLAPFTTLFSVGAVINSSENFLDGFEKFASILVDASVLNVVESAIQYSDGLPDYLGNQQINFVQQFVPAIFKSFTKIIDNSKKNKSGNFYEKLIKTTAANLPFFSYLVADKIDPYTGETEKIYQSGLLEAIFNSVLPIGIRPQVMSDYEREATRVGAETTGFTGRFKVNDKDYTVKDTEKYSKYRAEYINTHLGPIISGKQKVTVEDDNGKRITTTYDKLNDKQKKNVIDRLYTEATSITKIKWWTDLGNKYVVTNEDQYKQYRTLFDTRNIVYKEAWNKSKFMER